MSVYVYTYYNGYVICKILEVQVIYKHNILVYNCLFVVVFN